MISEQSPIKKAFMVLGPYSDFDLTGQKSSEKIYYTSLAGFCDDLLYFEFFQSSTFNKSI